MDGKRLPTPNDERGQARLTAYALDQVDESQRTEIESQLANNQFVQQQIEDTREFAALVSESLTQQPVRVATSELRAAVEHRFAEKESACSRRNMHMTAASTTRFNWPLWTALTVAVCLAIAVIPLGINSLSRGRMTTTVAQPTVVEPISTPDSTENPTAPQPSPNVESVAVDAITPESNEPETKVTAIANSVVATEVGTSDPLSVRLPTLANRVDIWPNVSELQTAKQRFGGSADDGYYNWLRHIESESERSSSAIGVSMSSPSATTDDQFGTTVFGGLSVNATYSDSPPIAIGNADFGQRGAYYEDTATWFDRIEDAGVNHRPEPPLFLGNQLITGGNIVQDTPTWFDRGANAGVVSRRQRHALTITGANHAPPTTFNSWGTGGSTGDSTHSFIDAMNSVRSASTTNATGTTVVTRLAQNYVSDTHQPPVRSTSPSTMIGDSLPSTAGLIIWTNASGNAAGTSDVTPPALNYLSDARLRPAKSTSPPGMFGDFIANVPVTAKTTTLAASGPPTTTTFDVDVPRRDFRLAKNDYSSSESEQYVPITENAFLQPYDPQFATSTFSIDVDTASYANVRRFLNNRQLPPVDAVRIEELINYFTYDYPQPTGDEPFSVNIEVAQCPWQIEHRLVRIGLKGKQITPTERPPCNLVFLLDVSGSMLESDKLPLLKRAMSMMVGELSENDRVTIVTYAGNAGLKLEPTTGDQHDVIRQAIDSLNAAGSTNGSAGIQLAYERAEQNLIKDGVNRVILATDGDLNVGVTDDDELVKLIKQKADSGVFLTVLGFGTGNLKDGKLEKLADNGNGVYAYIDSLREARRVLVEQISASLVTIAKDVKLQIEFNPAEVDSYRLIGYENRVMAARDFDDDKKDAGEIGAGHTVTALYEIVPTNSRGDAAKHNLAARPLKYQRPVQPVAAEFELTDAAGKGELFTLSLRYKAPDGEQSKLLEVSAEDTGATFNRSSTDFQFAAAVAAFGMLLRNSAHRGNASFEAVEEIASSAIGDDPKGYRTEFLDLVRRAKELER